MGAREEVHRRHDWVPTEGGRFACWGCPATASACRSCGEVLEQTGAIHAECASDARNLLREVRDLYRELPDVIASIAGLHAVSYRGGASGRHRRSTSTTILGGAALVMVSAGSVNQVRLGRLEQWTDVDRRLLVEEHEDPLSVLGVLCSWEDAWRHQLGLPVAEGSDLSSTVDFLLERTTWAGNTADGWVEYLGELRDLRFRLLAVTGRSTTPEATDVPCPYCAGTIVRKWTAAGLGDVRECDTCHLRFDSEAHFLMAIRQAHQDLPVTHPDALVTIDDAKRIYRGRVKPNTLDQWVLRGHLVECRRDVRGEALYRLGDIDARVQDAIA